MAKNDVCFQPKADIKEAELRFRMTKNMASIMLRNRPIVLVLFLATLVPCTLFAQSTDAIIYDEYRWGVHIAELSVSHTGDSAEYVLRRRDVYTDTWQDPVTAAAAELALNETFRLGGAIAQFPAQLAENAQGIL